MLQMLLRVNSVSMDNFISWTQFTFLHSFLLTLYKMDEDFQVFKKKFEKLQTIRGVGMFISALQVPVVGYM